MMLQISIKVVGYFFIIEQKRGAKASEQQVDRAKALFAP